MKQRNKNRRILSLVLLISLGFYNEIRACNGGLIGLKAVSQNFGSITGNFSMQLNCTAIDSAFIDSITFEAGSIFNLSTNNAWSNSNLLPNEISNASITVAYDVNNLPFYPKVFSIIVNTHTLDTLLINKHFAFNTYTPII